jgi:hypothetical protein
MSTRPSNSKRPDSPSENDSLHDLAAIANIFAFFLTAAALVFTGYQILNGNRIQRINTLRDLTTEFNRDPLYLNISMSIEACQPLYNDNKQSSGTYSWGQINRYLNFLDNLGFYQRQNAITLDMVQHSFGALIIEAYENKVLLHYVHKLQTTEHHAFKDFQHVATLLEQNDDNMDIIRKAQTCP